MLAGLLVIFAFLVAVGVRPRPTPRPIERVPEERSWPKASRSRLQFLSPTTTTRPHPVGRTTLPPAPGLSAGRHGVFVITCYALRGRTASGAPVSESGVAVDPRLIQLGSWITVEGLGRLQARDTGGAIKGMRLDIWKPSEAACRAWGVQRRAVTY